MVRPSMFSGIYVNNVPKTANIFKKVFLNAIVRKLQPGLTEVTIGTGRLLLSETTMDILETTNLAPQPDATDIVGTELELGVWVKDLEAVHQTIGDLKRTDDSAEIPFVSTIQIQPSGIQDFRFKLREGYYIRVTGERGNAQAA
ncbi:MAG: hypothetical protein ABI602_04370 [Candidatus Saccharibacteria bacterium]